MKYEWDNDKEAENRRRHGIDFLDAISVVVDPRRLERIDDRFSYDEERVLTIVMAFGNVLFVVTTLRGEDTCRLFSARRATRNEKDRYYSCED